MTSATRISGARLLARCLKQQGVDYLFGIVGFPVVPVAIAAQAEGITYIGMRNEQAASYAAQAASYLTGRPQGCLVVSGPGVIHALAGLANARENCWPMLLIGGASPIHQNGMGGFQEDLQVEAARPFSKYAHAIERVDRIPFYVEQAVRASLHGRPGPAYLDFPEDVIVAELDGEQADAVQARMSTVPPPPRSLADPVEVQRTLAMLREAQRPLVIVGKGMAWSRAEHEVRAFVEQTRIPFLATPMGKGVVPDDHPLSVGAARSYALQNADGVLLLGARLNWILHFGLPPRFADGVRVAQLDIAAEHVSQNVAAHAALIGDGQAVMAQLVAAWNEQPFVHAEESPWRAGIAAKIAANEQTVAAQANDDSAPMNYYRAFRDIREALPRDAIICSEGSNTMDIGRTQMPNAEPRHRLDAGTYGTMGVGLGFAIAAAVANPGRRVVAVEGDSAFGFSGMECETMCRYNLPITVIVLNNNGIGAGFEELPVGKPIPSMALLPSARYEKVMEAFGGRGFHVDKPSGLRAALDAALAHDGPSLVHVRIEPRAARKQQEFAWKT